MRTLRTLLSAPVHRIAALWTAGAIGLAALGWVLPSSMSAALIVFSIAFVGLAIAMVTEVRLKRALVRRDRFDSTVRDQTHRIERLRSAVREQTRRTEHLAEQGRRIEKTGEDLRAVAAGDKAVERLLGELAAARDAFLDLGARHASPPAGESGLQVTDAGPTDLLHVIATRHGIGIFDEHWFEYRQRLFEYLTLASINAQTRKNFTWLIVVDRDMPEQARRNLDRMIAGRPYIRLLQVELKADFKKAVAKWTREEATARGVAWTMTTRLDDDDAVHADLIRRLRIEADEFLGLDRHGPAVFAPTSGCNWVPSERMGFRSFHANPSMGLTLLEPADGLKTVYNWNHMRIQEQLAPSMAYFKSIAGDTIWWLYAHTNLSDQQHEGSNRRTKAYTHSSAFRLEAPLLAEFGITTEHAALLKDLPEPIPADSTHYLTKRGADVEAEIHDLRKRLRAKDHPGPAEAERIRARIIELHGIRKDMHRHIVRRPGERHEE